MRLHHKRHLLGRSCMWGYRQLFPCQGTGLEVHHHSLRRDQVLDRGRTSCIIGVSRACSAVHVDASPQQRRPLPGALQSEAGQGGLIYWDGRAYNKALSRLETREHKRTHVSSLVFSFGNISCYAPLSTNSVLERALLSMTTTLVCGGLGVSLVTWIR